MAPIEQPIDTIIGGAIAMETAANSALQSKVIERRV
jgi:hypothetical protein